MQNKLFILLVIIVASCQQEQNSMNSILNGFSGDEISQSFLSMNERLISSIKKYESSIEFTDTIRKNYNISLNTNEIILNYRKSIDFALSSLNDKEIDSLYRSNHRFLLDSLLEPLHLELHYQQDEFKEIKNISEIMVYGDSKTYQKENQLVKNQIFYNHIFQFLFRYKLEEEARDSYTFPIVKSDTLLSNGKRELGICIASSLKEDEFVHFLDVNGVLYDSKDVIEMSMIDGIIRIQYDPMTTSDSFDIKTITIKNFSGEEVTAIKKYATIKK